MTIHLNAGNFFKYYIFNPNDKTLTKHDSNIARIATWTFGFATLGLGHLFCLCFLYDRNVTKISKSPKISDVAKQKGVAQTNPPLQPEKTAEQLKPLIDPKTTHEKVKATNKPQTADRVAVKHHNIEIEVKVVIDICELPTDAIVNAANAHLAAGAGVCGAIHAKGGSGIFQECADYLKAQGKSSLEEGDAMITSGGKLQAKHVIHAVGPVWKNTTSIEAENDKKKLYNAYYNSLKRAHENSLKSIAFPSLSTGIFGFPIDQAAPIAMQAFKDFAEQNPDSSVKSITMAVWSGSFKHYSNALKDKIISAKKEDNIVTEIKAKKSPTDFLYDFYKGVGPDIEGRYIHQIWGWSDDNKEYFHDYIQWLFPLKKQSAFNRKAPVLNPALIKIMRNDPDVMANFKKSFGAMMAFYGLKYNENLKSLLPAPNFDQRFNLWYAEDNHNLLRITRILTSLKIMGLEDEANALFEKLSEFHEQDPYIAKESFKFWQNAVKG